MQHHGLYNFLICDAQIGAQKNKILLPPERSRVITVATQPHVPLSTEPLEAFAATSQGGGPTRVERVMPERSTSQSLSKHGLNYLLGKLLQPLYLGPSIGTTEKAASGEACCRLPQK